MKAKTLIGVMILMILPTVVCNPPGSKDTSHQADTEAVVVTHTPTIAPTDTPSPPMPNLTGLPMLNDAADVLSRDEYSPLYYTNQDALAVLDFYREELLKLDWQLDYQNSQCLDDRRLTRRCMGWHGGGDNPAESPIFFLRGEDEYLTLNALEENGQINVILSIDPDVYGD